MIGHTHTYMQANQSWVNPNKGIIILCPTCKWQWTYHGNRIYYCGCSQCHRSINIKKNMISRALEHKLEEIEQELVK